MNALPTADLDNIVELIDDWSQFKKARIFITGGTGLFGIWMVSALLRANIYFNLGLEITILTRNQDDFKSRHPTLASAQNVKILVGDVVNFEYPRERYDYLFHFATTTASDTFNGEDQLKKMEMLYLGTKRVLDFAVTSGVKKILFTSSGVVYGSIGSELNGIAENYHGAPDVSRPDAALGEGKRIAEYLCAYYQEKYGISYAIGRCFSFVGPLLPLSLHYAIGNFIKNCIHNEEIIINGDGSPVRSYLYMGDAINWLLQLVLSDKSKSTYNIGSSRSISIENLARLTKDVLASKNKVTIKGLQTSADGNFARNFYIPDISLIKRDFKITESTSLEKSIMKTSQFYASAKFRFTSKPIAAEKTHKQ
jgi:UDP-glucuronate decarboxylase